MSSNCRSSLFLSLRDLQTLAKLLGCPSYGTKETLIVRVLAERELRFKLARFTKLSSRVGGVKL
jgi:hypothetical protein